MSVATTLAAAAYLQVLCVNISSESSIGRERVMIGGENERELEKESGRRVQDTKKKKQF